MLKEPLGILLLIISFIIWASFIFKKDSSSLEGASNDSNGSTPAKLIFSIVVSFITSGWYYLWLGKLSQNPIQSSLILIISSYVLYLFLTDAEKLGRLILLVIVLGIFGSISGLFSSTTNVGNSVETYDFNRK